MSELNITLINVGTGDSIFIESITKSGDKHYALIDSNDSDQLRATHVFLKHFFGIHGMPSTPVFEFIMMTHSHADHGQGLKNIIKQYGTNNFYHPACHSWGAGLTALLNYATRSAKRKGKVKFLQQVDDGHAMNKLGDASVNILWPKSGATASTNENDNSIVLEITLGTISVILTGDAEEAVWNSISSSIPATTRFFKVPHHGSKNGTFDSTQTKTPYLDQLVNHSPDARMGISCHPVPHGHPDGIVITEFANKTKGHYRTDEHQHITFSTDGTNATVASTTIATI